MTRGTEVQKGETLHMQVNVLKGLVNFFFQNALQNNFFFVCFHKGYSSVKMFNQCCK